MMDEGIDSGTDGFLAGWMMNGDGWCYGLNVTP